MEVNVRIAGAAGQGTQTTADLLGKAITRAGLFASAYLDAESRIRGGLNFTRLRIADRPLAGVRSRFEILVALTEEAAAALRAELAPGGILLSQAGPGPLSLDALARESGSEKAAGSAALGAVAAILELPEDLVFGALGERFKEPLLEVNRNAYRRGAEAARAAGLGGRHRLSPGKPPARPRLWLAGAEAIALGAVAGGVTFFAGYPMSPATGIMTTLAAHAAQAGLHVEQAEDEVAAVNMVAGASFTGSRSMTATSGGGFCLMTEGISLLGMIEAPAVVALAQRPGPATGLPTRYAQGDLNLARHAGHGFFPRIVLAPRSIADAFEVTAYAFDLAERYQCPVFVLVDQLLNDGQATCERPETRHLPRDRHFLPVEQLEQLSEYRRYAWAENGLSPMAAPGVSRHLVYADSDEHDEAGHMIESGAAASLMVRKRRAKLDTVRKAAWAEEPDRDPAGRTLVVSWGSTGDTLGEAVADCRHAGSDVAHLHLRWLWPAPAGLAQVVSRARRVVAVEASASVELAPYLAEVTGRTPDARLGRDDGRPFTVETLARDLAAELDR